MTNESTAIVEPAEEGRFYVYCPEVPGANGQGETLEERLGDLAAEIGLILGVLRQSAGA